MPSASQAPPFRLLAKRLARGKTQQELAEVAGVTQAVITRLESGENGVHASKVADVARAYGITPDELGEWIAYHQERRRDERQSAAEREAVASK